MKHLLLLFSFLLLSLASIAQPVNDDCDGIINLGEAPLCPIPDIFTNLNATPSDVLSVPTCFNGGTVQNDVWFEFTIPIDGSIVDLSISVTSTGMPDGIIMPQITLYRGVCLPGGLDELACASAPLDGTEASFDVFGLTPGPGISYFIRVNDYSASASPNWGDFNLCIEEYTEPPNCIGNLNSTQCSGTIYDSGGPDGDYSNNDDCTYTICPTQFHECIILNVVEYNVEAGFDDIEIYGGQDASGVLLATLGGAGSDFEVQVIDDCATIVFQSDGSVTNPGFEISWQCTADTCTVPPIVSCDEPVSIASLPYAGTDLSTCFAGNTVQNGPCNVNLAGDDYIFTYNSPGDECITIALEGANASTGVSVYADCPNLATDCLGAAGSGFGETDPVINAVELEDPGTYYIVVANGGNCTPFNITVDTTTCPVTSSTACTGTFFDNGGPDGNYPNNDEFEFNICPEDPFGCLIVTVDEFDTENNFDEIVIISGEDANGTIISTISGAGTDFEVQIDNTCATILFSSDGSVNNPGFQISWACSQDTCTIPPIVSCDEPVVVPNLPYVGNGLSTCFAGNTVQAGPCPSDFFLGGEDYIFTYDSPGNECILVALAGSTASTGIAVYDDCPDVATECINAAGGGFGEVDPSLTAILTDPGTYYIAIANANECTDFDILIEQTDCPVTFSSECTGTIYDSGGPNGDYPNNDVYEFNICPSDPFGCLIITVEDYQIENGFDNLFIIAGPDASGTVVAEVTGTGTGFEVPVNDDCATIFFTSDGSVTNPGFELSWECQADTCDIPPIISCDAPINIGMLPYGADDLSTCFAGNTVQDGPCTNDFFLNGEDYIFTYDSPGDECITVSLTGTSVSTGVAVYDDCPDVATECISQAGGGFNQVDPTIDAAFLDEAGTYYIVVSNPNLCTAFNITVDTVTCPITFPSAADCEDALLLSGCDANEPAVLNVDIGSPLVDYFIPGVNDGCWLGVGDENYTWFYFEAQADGDFGFIMGSADPDEFLDIDLQVWGPMQTEEEACDYVLTNQPIRSTWAAPGYDDLTGLADVHPSLGNAVTDECEFAGGDGFVSTIPVQEGEIYFILTNDYSGVIFDGAVAVDFSPTTPGVFETQEQVFTIPSDTTLCEGEITQLVADGADIYIWDDPTGTLSCTDCPNPIASPTESTTYGLSMANICGNITTNVTVEIYKVKAGPDATVCVGEQFQIEAGSNYSDAVYEWGPTIDGLSCTDCPVPTVTAQAEGTYEYVVTLITPICTLSDTMVLEVLNGQAPQYMVSPDTLLCEGESTNLGDPANSNANTYMWTSLPIGFTSQLNNPVVTPSETSTYYVEVTNPTCAVSSFDSVHVQVDQLPILDLISDTILCNPDSLVLGNTTPQTDVVYAWTSTNGMVDSVANPIVFADEDATYILTATLNGCEISDTIDVTVFDVTMDILGPDTNYICLGAGVSLIALATPSGTPVEWTSSDGSVNTTATNIIVNPEVTTLYTATIAEPGTPCIAVDSILIWVDSLPADLSIMPQDTMICNGELVILESPTYDPIYYPNITHQWTPNSGLQSPDTLFNLVVQPGETTTYVRETINGACSSIDTAMVIVAPTTEITITPSNPSICPGESVDLVATSPDIDQITEIAWMPEDGTMSCTDCLDPTVTPSSTTTYMIEGEFEGCPVNSQVTVTVIPSPTVSFPNNNIICPGESITLNQNPNAGFTYVWTSTDPNFGTSTDSAPTVSPTEDATYFVTVNNQGCTADFEYTVIAANADITVSPAQATICPGEEVELTATTTGTAGTISWSGGNGTGETITVSPNGMTSYTATLTYGDNCTVSATSTISVLPIVDVDIILTAPMSPSDSIYQGEVFSLQAITNPDVNSSASFEWTYNGNPIGGNGPTLTTQSLFPDNTFTVTVTTENGCEFFDEFYQPAIPPVYQLPNAFTPDGDGLNDVFKVVYLGLIEVETFMVFNRWGQLVYESNDIDQGWDGTHNDKPAISDVYVYLIKLKTPGETIELKGDVTLIR